MAARTWPTQVAAAASAKASAPVGSPAGRPLYLDGRSRSIEVQLRGPALSILRGTQRLELPLQRLSRVLVCGTVRLDSAALVACLQHRVPIVFLDLRSQPVGSALPLYGRSSCLDELLGAWVDQPRWRDQYDDWLRAQRFRVLRRWRRLRQESDQPVAPQEWTEAVRSFVYRAEPALESPYASGCYARTIATLMRAGVRTQYRSCDGGVLALAADLASLVDRSVALQVGRLGAALEGRRDLVARAAEGGAAEIDALLLDFLGRLRRCAADWVEPWP